MKKFETVINIVIFVLGVIGFIFLTMVLPFILLGYSILETGLNFGTFLIFAISVILFRTGYKGLLKIITTFL